MSDAVRGQVASAAAEVYDAFFVPALFQQWAPVIVDSAGLSRGQSAIDIACGTGAIARELALRVGTDGRVVGLDINEGMLAVARQRSPDIEWVRGRAEELPYADGTFSAVTCSHGLMFFDDRRAALSEMHRVLRSGGRIVVSTWDRLDSTPGYRDMVALLERLFDQPVADALRAPFVLGDPEELCALFGAAGLPDVEIRTVTGTARFTSLDDWIHTDVRGWTLSDMIDDEQFDLLLTAARRELRGYVQSDGTVTFDAPAHIITSVKSA